MIQKTLFETNESVLSKDVPEEPTPKFVRGSDTSRAAAKGIAPSASALRLQILEWIRDLGAWGATSDEIERMYDLKHQTCSARLSELKKSGELIDSGKRRETRSGSKAAVLVCKEFVR